MRQGSRVRFPTVALLSLRLRPPAGLIHTRCATVPVHSLPIKLPIVSVFLIPNKQITAYVALSIGDYFEFVKFSTFSISPGIG